MLIKEYRIPLPLSVDEYKIAQLYMIAKKSRQETQGAGSGLEILVNEPYENGPGGAGQYTKKIFHVGNHLPGWFKSLLPKAALSVEEEAWNAYPYTKTRYTCSFVEKFFLDIETLYCGDVGTQANVFNLQGSDRNRTVEVIDIVKDQSVEYVEEEDPTKYVSEVTGRGPLLANWLDKYKKDSNLNNGNVMCAYKLCRVEFRYWGMQTKLEKFIDDVAVRKTVVRAHRQAWVWQDEWFKLTMDDIRRIEKETQEILRQKMASTNAASNNGSGNLLQSRTPSENKENVESGGGFDYYSTTNTKVNPLTFTFGSIEKSEMDHDTSTIKRIKQQSSRYLETPSLSPSSTPSPSPSPSPSFNITGRLYSGVIKHENSDDDDDDEEEDEDEGEFYDCQEDINRERRMLTKWASLDVYNEEGDYSIPDGLQGDLLHSKGDDSGSTTPSIGELNSCKISDLFLVLHAGSVLDVGDDLTSKKSDIMTLRGSFETVIKQHYAGMMDSIAIRLVPCPTVNSVSLNILSSLSPYSFDVSPFYADGAFHVTNDSIPIGIIPVLSTVSVQYVDAVHAVINTANNVYREFLKSKDGSGFNGHVYFIGDSIGSVLAYDALCYNNQPSCQRNEKNEPVLAKNVIGEVKISGESSHLVDTLNKEFSEKFILNEMTEDVIRLEFKVRELYMFGSPLGLLLAYRSVTREKNYNIGSSDDGSVCRPNVRQVYNLFHPTDPMAFRLEPLISSRFSILPPVNTPQFEKHPLGDQFSNLLADTMQSNQQLFLGDVSNTTSMGVAVCNSMQMRRISASSISSCHSTSTTISVVQPPSQLRSELTTSMTAEWLEKLAEKWWGKKRLDYALYCPEGLTNFPTYSLPHLFHASYWESYDVVAFILQQLDGFGRRFILNEGLPSSSGYESSEQCEKWIKKRTSVKLSKLKNIGANHRANDVIVKEGNDQTLVARFMYGSYDVITLAGEKVDIFAMNDFSAGDWMYLSTQITDKSGRIVYTIPPDKAFGYGIHHVKMVVRGDRSSVDFRLAVLPPKTECAVFSIDGSFTASMSFTGRDPKVRAGAVDIVRHWQELGYLIIYISARPDMQQQFVLPWLTEHNFPYGLVIFADRFSTDPLGYKISYLKNLMIEHDVVICTAYGSCKDIHVYTSIGLQSSQIFIVGKVKQKYQSLATVLADGYAAHLATLVSCTGPRPARGNARMVLIPRGCFGYKSSLKRRRSAKRSSSFPLKSTYAVSKQSPLAKDGNAPDPR